MPQTIQYTPIGIIHTPFAEPKGVPIQPGRGKGIQGTIEIFDAYVDGLSDVDGFSHIILLYHLHLSKGYKLKVIPFMDSVERGVFSTRAPRRPNSIGLSVVKLRSIDGNIIHFENVDIVDGTPLLDIKPFVPGFDKGEKIKTGWLENKADRNDGKKADDRFLHE